MGKGTRQTRKYLGAVANEAITAAALDIIEFEEPERSSLTTVTLTATEFTSLCPVTGQPDVGVLKIEYIPRGRLLETKGLKLYLQSFREKKAFNEVIVGLIYRELFDMLRPRELKVTGTFNTRGGIVVEATCRESNREAKTADDQ